MGGALLASLLLSGAEAKAEGYQVNTLITRQLGMGHAGIGMKLGAESQFFNPAGMAFMTDNVDLSASINAIRIDLRRATRRHAVGSRV